jgi:guanidinoacetate N-methyltransferase
MTTKESFGDVRDLTTKTRTKIGFAERDAWRAAPAVFDEHTLKIHDHPVMEDWEDGYMRCLADIAAASGGTVLEVGYGMGISAAYIQQHVVSRHLIIEANADVFMRLETFARAHPSAEPLFGFWEEVTAAIPSESVDGILFDTYPLCEAEIHRNHFPFFAEAHRILAPGGTLTYYSDEIDSFSAQHLQLLRDAGFTRIDKRICEVEPPAECAYWKSRTLLAPVIRK